MSDLRLLTVHAHADDETITMGGLLARCADEGVETMVVTCTDGQLATIFDEEMASREAELRPRLGEIRRDELREACRILGVGHLEFLGYHDSGMAGEATNHADGAFWRADLDEAAGRVAALVRSFRPHVVVTYDGYGGYGHPDHIQAHRATLVGVEAARMAGMYPQAGPPWVVSKLYYTAFPRSMAERAVEMASSAGMKSPFGDASIEDLTFVTPDELVTTAVDCAAQYRRKREALQAHRSQITADFPLLSLPEEVGMAFFGDEHFQLAFSRVPTGVPESDVFAGLR